MKDEARLFVGLELGDEARAVLGGYRREMEGLVAGKLTCPSLYHLTLCFLGQTPRGRIPELCALLDRMRSRPFALRFGGLGSFKDSSILWIGIREPHPELCALQLALTNALNDAGFSVERSIYSPHITLGRQMRRTGELPDPPQAAFGVNHITLFESARVDGRLAYVPLYRANIE